MTKRNGKSPVVMSKSKLLLPRMEFVELDSTTGEGLFVKELGGKTLLEYREKVKSFENEPSELQSLEILTDLVLKTACNADGTPFFTEEEVQLFADASIANLQALAFFAMKMSGISEATNNLKNDQNSSSADG